MGGDHHIGLLQRRVRAPEQADDVAELHRPAARLVEVDVTVARPGPAGIASKRPTTAGSWTAIVGTPSRRLARRRRRLGVDQPPGAQPGGRSGSRLTLTTRAAFAARIRDWNHGSTPGPGRRSARSTLRRSGSSTSTTLPARSSGFRSPRRLELDLDRRRGRRRRSRRPGPRLTRSLPTAIVLPPPGELEAEARRVGLLDLPLGGLEIAVVADRLEPGPAELGGDVLGGQVEPARGGVAALRGGPRPGTRGAP